MKRVFWDILVDSNNFRMFRSNLPSKDLLALLDSLKTDVSLAENWKIVKIKMAREKGEKEKMIADFVSIDLAVEALSKKSRSILHPLIASQVEYLPFETPVGPYYGLHVRYVDCLDKPRIEAKYFSDGRIMRVIKYAFHWEKLEAVHIFRLPELGLSRLFVSDEFKRLVEENGLTGLLFYPVPLVEEQ